MKATQIAAAQAQQITNSVDYLQRLLADEEGRHERAADAVSYICAEVLRFLDDPESVGYDVLVNARAQVLAMHSGNFSPALGNPLPSHAAHP